MSLLNPALADLILACIQPFPLNPSFRPLAPLADATKTRIFNTYVHNIIQPNATDAVVVRAISEKFGVGMDRIRAVIRLKELEKSWKDAVSDARALLGPCSSSLERLSRQIADRSHT